jgi:hypothetical protein
MTTETTETTEPIRCPACGSIMDYIGPHAVWDEMVDGRPIVVFDPDVSKGGMIVTHRCRRRPDHLGYFPEDVP